MSNTDLLKKLVLVQYLKSVENLEIEDRLKELEKEIEEEDVMKKLVLNRYLQGKKAKQITPAEDLDEDEEDEEEEKEEGEEEAKKGEGDEDGDEGDEEEDEGDEDKDEDDEEEGEEEKDGKISIKQDIDEIKSEIENIKDLISSLKMRRLTSTKDIKKSLGKISSAIFSLQAGKGVQTVNVPAIDNPKSNDDFVTYVMVPITKETIYRRFENKSIRITNKLQHDNYTIIYPEIKRLIQAFKRNNTEYLNNVYKLAKLENHDLEVYTKIATIKQSNEQYKDLVANSKKYIGFSWFTGSSTSRFDLDVPDNVIPQPITDRFVQVDAFTGGKKRLTSEQRALVSASTINMTKEQLMSMIMLLDGLASGDNEVIDLAI